MKNLILATFAVAALLITSCKNENEQVKNEVENRIAAVKASFLSVKILVILYKNITFKIENNAAGILNAHMFWVEKSHPKIALNQVGIGGFS